jgi:acyl-CoA thioesterase FadM
MTRVATSPEPLALACRPRFEGANIATWIGFKQFMLLAEEAVVAWFRERALGPREAAQRHGLGLELLDSSVQLPALLELDDELVARVTARAPGRFAVTLHVRRPGGELLALRGRVAAGLVALEEDAAAPVPREPLPPSLAPLVLPALRAPGVVPEDRRLDPPGAAATPFDDGAPFHWTWRARYFHCHHSRHVRHAAYVGALEEVVERFLADRGMSIRTLLEERGWIPVVSRARVQVVRAARMEELVHTTFAVRELLKRRAFDATMDCHVRRGDRLLHVASARILHGYAAARGPQAGQLVELDPRTCAVLAGER